jgi:DNA-binding NtrC family response regulator
MMDSPRSTSSREGAGGCLPRTSTKKILVVDDDKHVRGFLKDFLNVKGFDLRTASDGEEGLKVYHQFRPDLVVTDIFMPRKSGFQLVAELRAEDPDVRVIFITGCLHEPHIAKQVETELSEHPEYQALPKPFDLNAMLQSIERALRW